MLHGNVAAPLSDHHPQLTLVVDLDRDGGHFDDCTGAHHARRQFGEPGLVHGPLDAHFPDVVLVVAGDTQEYRGPRHGSEQRGRLERHPPGRSGRCTQ